MLPPLHSLDLQVHAATLLTPQQAGRLGCGGPAFIVSTAHELMLHDMQLGGIECPTLRRLGGGYEMPAATVLRQGTDQLLLADLHPAQHQFTLYTLSLRDADQRYATPLLRATGQPLQMALSGSTLFYADHQRGALMAVDLDSSSTLLPRIALNHLESPLGVTLALGSSEASQVDQPASVLVSERRPGRVCSLQPDLLTGGSVWQVERGELHSPRLLSIDEVTGELLVPQFATFGYVQSLDPASGRLRTLLRLASHQRPMQAWRRGDWLIVAETGGMRCWDVDAARQALRQGASSQDRRLPAPAP